MMRSLRSRRRMIKSMECMSLADDCCEHGARDGHNARDTLMNCFGLSYLCGSISGGVRRVVTFDFKSLLATSASHIAQHLYTMSNDLRIDSS